jgi:glycosyltransferase involved in cell wall biosynthesis
MTRPARADSRRLLIVVNDLPFFLSHRLSIAVGARGDGWDVHLATPPSPEYRVLPRWITHHPLRISRSGTALFSELRTFQESVRLLRRVAPSVVHTVTAKAMIHAGIAARVARVPGLVIAVPGLGHLFVGSKRRTRLARSVAVRLFATAMGHPNCRVIVQNPDDRRVLEEAGALTSAEVVLIRGSGVDLTSFRAHPEPDGIPVVLMAARLVREKGVLEFAEAARIVRRTTDCRFVLAGGPDPANPSGLCETDLQPWLRDHSIEWLGHRSDIAELLQQCALFVLPSYYGEGVPKSLIEAAAAGRAIVTTDMPGCREVVTHGINGLLVPPRDPDALAAAIQSLLGDHARRAAMGQAGRLRAEAEFSVHDVVRRHLQLYDELARAPRPGA